MRTIEHWLIEGKRDPQLKRWVVDLIYQEGSPNDQNRPCFVVYLDEEFSIQWYYSPSLLSVTGPVVNSVQPNLPPAAKTEEQKTEEQKTEEQKTEEQKTEEQKTEEQKTEEQKTEEQKTEEQKTEEQKTEEQKTEEQKTEEQKTEEQKPGEQNLENPKKFQTDLMYATSPSQAACFPNDFNLILNDIVHLETLSNNLRRPAPKWYHPARMFSKIGAEFDRGREIDPDSCDFSQMKRRHSQLRSTRRLIAEALGRTYEWIDVGPEEQDPRSIAARSAILTAQNFLKARSNDLGRSYLLSGALWATAFCLILAMVFTAVYANSYDGKREQARRDSEFSAIRMTADIGLPLDDMKKAFPQAEAIIDSLAAQKAAIDSKNTRIHDREKKIAEEKAKLTTIRDEMTKLNTQISESSKVAAGPAMFSELSSKIDSLIDAEPNARPTSWLDRDGWDLLMFSLTGAFGAMLSLLMSASKRDYDMGAGRPIHILEGVTRIIVGVLGAGFITIAIKSGFLLGYLTQESAASFSSSVTDSTRLMWLHYFFAFIAGVSERFVPSFISVVEAQTQSSKQPG